VGPEMFAEPGAKEKKPAMEALQVKGGDLNGTHVRDFLDCVKSRKRPNADVEEGHRSAVMCHLGNISTRLGRSLKWDAAKQQVAVDAEANQMLSRPYRAPWRLSWPFRCTRKFSLSKHTSTASSVRAAGCTESQAAHCRFSKASCDAKHNAG